MPTPTQAWLRFERESLGLSIRQAAKTFNTSRSVMNRAERGGPNGANDKRQAQLLDRVAANAGVEFGSWPTPEPAAVNKIIWWWQQHPLDRLAWCLQARRNDWQTPLRHVIRELLPLPAIITGEAALDFMLPPAGRRPPAAWTLTCPWITEPYVLTNRYLGIVRLQPVSGSERAVRIPSRTGQPQHGLQLIHPRELIMTLGWSPDMAAAVQAADLVGAAGLAGVGHPQRRVQRHYSLEIYEEFDCDELEEPDGLGAGQHVVPGWFVGGAGEQGGTCDPRVAGLDRPAVGPDVSPLGHENPARVILGRDTERAALEPRSPGEYGKHGGPVSCQISPDETDDR